MASGGEDPASGLFNIRANYPSSAAKLTGLGSSRHAGCAIVRCCCFGLERTKPARLSPPFARSGPFPRGKPSTGQAREFPPNQTDDVPHSHLPACKGRHCAVTCHLRSITDSYSRPSKNVKSSNLSRRGIELRKRRTLSAKFMRSGILWASDESARRRRLRHGPQ